MPNCHGPEKAACMHSCKSSGSKVRLENGFIFTLQSIVLTALVYYCIILIELETLDL